MDGFFLGNPSAPIQVEAFTDLLCPDCAADWSTVKAMLAHYGPDKVSLRLHFFPLPYHINAFKTAWTAHVIRALNGSDAGVFAWTDLLYSGVQQQFWEGEPSVAGLNTTGVELLLASTAAGLGYDAAAVYAGLQNSDFDEATRIGFKYAASRYTTGTPHYLINGAPVDDQLGNGALSDWEALIDSLSAAGPRAAGKGAAKGKRRAGKRSTC